MQSSTENKDSFPSSSSDDSSIRFPEVGEHENIENDDVEEEEVEEKPFTFYLPSCHCLEEKKQQDKKFHLELRERGPRDILAPDHPALDKFQKALKDHLLRQIEHLKDEIFELDSTAKTKDAHREEMGIEAYELQQVVCKQQKVLEEYIDNVKTATAAREEVELELKECKANYKTEVEILMAYEKEEKELRNELESTNLLLQQTAKWEKDVESDLAVSKRMTEKMRKDQMKLMSDKQKQDMVLYRLQAEVWKLETALANTDMKLTVKEKEREELAQAVAEGTTNIEALDTEYRCLMHSWNSVTVAISNRDKVLMCVNEELNKYIEDQKNILCETEQITKLTKKEMLKNEKLTSIKQRIMSDMIICKNLIDEELIKQTSLEKRISSYQAIIDQTEADIAKVVLDSNADETILNLQARECDKKNQMILDWEEKIFMILEDETTNNKASQHLAGRLRQIKSMNRKLEITLALSENKNAVIQSKLESQISINSDLNNLVKDLNLQRQHLEKEINEYQEKLKVFDSLIVKRQRHTDKLSTRVMEMVTIIGGKEVSPCEVRIKTLEKNIEEFKSSIKELQMFWMREQRNVLNLSETRQEQIGNNDLLRKQIMLLQQKNLKVTDEINAIKKQDIKISKNIVNLHNQILTKTEFLHKTKDQRRSMDSHHELTQTEFFGKLKEVELQCLKLEAGIVELEEDKLIISKQLLEVHREILEWEKKLHILVDTKNQIQQEKGAEGEIGQMKIEVHKMEVRHVQLKKAQEKLMTDLEYCVFRREAIVASSEAREKRSKFGIEKTRINFKRKLDDTKNKIKQVENEAQLVRNKIEKVAEEKEKLGNQMNLIKDETEEIKKQIEHILDAYENVKTNKMMQFEILVMKQKKLNILSDLARGKKLSLAYKNQCSLKQEYDQNEEINNKLLTIVDNLKTNFPDYKHHFNRILNTLNLPKVYAGDTDSWICHDYRDENPIFY